MTIRTHRTGTITLDAATHTATLPDVTGRVKCIAIKPSGTSTDFRISCSKAGITEYLFGESAVVSVAAAGVVIVPQKLAVDTDNGALTNTSNTYVDFILDSQDITIAVSNGAASETFSVEIIVEE